MERCVVSVGVADLEGFSEACAEMELEAIHAMLQDAFRRAGDEVLRRDGRIVKYLGDGMIFAFESAAGAAGAARAIAALEGGLKYAVSVATGEVLLCELGHPARALPDVIGEPVNRAFVQLQLISGSGGGAVLCPATERAAAAETAG